MSWGGYLWCDDNTLSMANLKRTRIMVWAWSYTVNSTKILTVMEKKYAIEVKKVDGDNVFCTEEGPGCHGDLWWL